MLKVFLSLSLKGSYLIARGNTPGINVPGILRPVRAKYLQIHLLPLQGAMLVIFAFPGCYPGL